MLVNNILLAFVNIVSRFAPSLPVGVRSGNEGIKKQAE